MTQTVAQKALEFINTQIANGNTIYISTCLKVTSVTAKNVAAWDKLGLSLFKIGKDGSLLMGSGKKYVTIVTPTNSLVGITAQ